MNMRRTGVVAGASLAAVAGLAAVLSSAGLLETDDAAKAGSSALSLYGVAEVVHTGADGAVLDTQTVRNQLLDAGEDFILEQVFSDGTGAVADSLQIGAICLSADEGTSITEGLSASDFNTNHDTDQNTRDTGIGTSSIMGDDAHHCLADVDVEKSSQIATIGPLTFISNNTSTSGFESNWKPDVKVQMIGICRGFTTVNADTCTAPLFAAVDINDVTLAEGETLTVTYRFNMQSDNS